MRHVAPILVLAALALGACGGGGSGDNTSTRDAQATVHRYFAALAGGDAPGACLQMTEHSREQLGEFAEVLHLKSSSCAATIGALLTSPAAARLRTLRAARVTATERQGRKITVHVDGVDRPIALVREERSWRIASSPLVEADKLPGGSEGEQTAG